MHLAETLGGCGLHLPFGCSSQLQILARVRVQTIQQGHSLGTLHVLWSLRGYMRTSQCKGVSYNAIWTIATLSNAIKQSMKPWQDAPFNVYFHTVWQIFIQYNGTYIQQKLYFKIGCLNGVLYSQISFSCNIDFYGFTHLLHHHSKGWLWWWWWSATW